MKGIILAGGKADQSLCQIYGDIPTALIPIYGKPIIFHILDKLISTSIEDIFIAVGYKSERVKLLIDNIYTSKISINYVDVDYTKKPGISLFKALSAIEKGKVFISLADTVIDLDKELIEKGDIIFSSSNYDTSSKWCLVKKNSKDEVVKFIEKKEKKSNLKNEALVGVYIFNDISKTLSDKRLVESENFEISKVLEVYNSHNPLKVEKSTNWLDFGHLDKYQKSKKRLLEARSFNTLLFDDLLGTVTKKSAHNQKLISEINWQLNLPKQLKVLSPRVIDYNLETNPFITMEYYSYQTMTEIWLYSEYNNQVLSKVIDKLLAILTLFEQEKREVPFHDYKSIYIDKTNERLSLIKDLNDADFNYFLEGDNEGKVIINNKKYNSWKLLEEKVYNQVENLYQKEHNCLIHGDYCFSNLLYDVNSGVVRLLDPRGTWGSSENGDIKYDLAKLRHSISGSYDYIVNDLFSYNFTEQGFDYKIYERPENNLIKEFFDERLSLKFNLKDIKLIEGLLFLSMIPLHSNSKSRQKLMFARAIELLNVIN